MSWIAELAAWSMLAVGVLLFVAQMGALEIGFWTGRRYARGQSEHSEGAGVVVAGLLGLLAFVLALTLSFANNRFAERRMGSLAEANAIGTAWLRAKAVDHPHAVEIARLVEDYARVRSRFVQSSREPASIEAANAQTNQLQSEIWGHLTGLVREQTTPLTVALMSALNDTFDSSTTERFAYAFTLPPQLFWLLIGMALLGMLALGFQLGLRGRPLRLLAGLLTATWTIVIISILDLAAPRLGSWRTSAIAYDWTIAGFQGGVTVPPLPSRPQ